MKTIYLIRHSKPNKKKFIGEDISLSQEGFMKAKEFSNKLKNKITCYSSTLLRAKQTAEILSNNVITDERLIERIVGNEKFSKEDWEKQYIDIYYKKENGESFFEVGNRIEEVIIEILNNMNDNEEVYVVSHAAAICSYLIKYCDVLVTNVDLKEREIRFNNKIIMSGKFYTPSAFKISYMENKIIDIKYLY